MSAQIARTKVEIFSSPCLFDDHFVKDWTAEGGAVVTTDSGIVKLRLVPESEAYEGKLMKQIES